MARIALIDPSGRSTTTVQAVLGRHHEVLVRTRIHAPGDCDLVIADLRHDDLCDTGMLRSLGSFGPVLLLVDRLQPIPVAVVESADLSVLRKPFDAFELRIGVEKLLRVASLPVAGTFVPRLEEEDAQWLEFPFVPAPAGAVLRRAAKLAAPLWILGEPGSGRRRVAMAVCRAVDPPLRVVTLFPDEALAAILEREREREAEPFALLVPEIERRALLEQERLALLVGGNVGFRLIATSIEDAGEAVLAGTFSRSLYQHLSGLAVQLSPLRERPVTIPPLVQLLVRRICRRLDLGDPVSFSPDAMARLQTYMWPGNVFELEAVLNRTLVHAADKDLRTRALEADEILFMPDDTGRMRPPARTSGAGILARLPGSTPPASRADHVDVRHVVAGLAHDLRNPMTTIRTFASTLGTTKGVDDDARRLADLASEACGRIDGYLDTLQRYVDLPQPTARSCDLLEIAGRVLERENAMASDPRGLVREGSVRSICDPEQMEFVFENVVASLRAEAGESAKIAVRTDASGLCFDVASGRGAGATLRALVGESGVRSTTWRMLLAKVVSERNGWVVEEEAVGDVLRIRCRPVRGEVEGRNEQAYRTDR